MNKVTIVDIDISQNHSKYYKIPREEINVNIYLFTYICLDEEEFPDLILYEHFVNHYLNYGIDSKHFYIVPCGTGNHNRAYNQFKKVNKKYNIKNIKLIKKQYDIKEHEIIYDKWRRTINKKNWIVKADLDEFNNYGHFLTIYDCAKWLQENNFTAIRGQLMDCVSNDNKLKPILPDENIFSQFPKRAKITLHALNQNTNKILLAKPYVELIWGHHNTISDPEVHPKTYESDFYSFHFKWTDILSKRYDRALRTQDNELYTGFSDTFIKTKHLIKNNKINMYIK